MNPINEYLSWTYALAIHRAQDRFAMIKKAHESPEANAEMVYPYVVEGQGKILAGFCSPSGRDYTQIRAESEDGQHEVAARWVRNKAAHCLARPLQNKAGKLGEALGTGEATINPGLRWMDTEQVFASAIDADSRKVRQDQYEHWFSGRLVYPTLVACVRWIS
jgi:hypothetical protein